MNIVITGIGLVTPLGLGREQTWKGLLEGRSAIVPTADGLEAAVAGVSVNGARSRMGEFALLAAREALLHAAIDAGTRERPIGCAVSQSKPTANAALSPDLLLSSFSGWSPEALLQRSLSLRGPTANIAAACATGIASIAAAAQWLRFGVCEIALAGASESSLVPLYRAGFRNMGVLAEGRSAAAVRPFDAARSGFAIGEGAGVLVLETEDSARRRGVPILARLGATALRHSGRDAVRFDGDGSAVASLLRQAVAGRPAPGYINAHGTGTLLNDAAEAAGIARAFDGASTPAVSSTKAAMGHLLGAAGAVEAAIALLALRDGAAPPSLHVEKMDPGFSIRLIRGTALRERFRSTVSLSYGFGGQMGAVVWEAA